jgi:hypothetical protein
MFTKDEREQLLQFCSVELDREVFLTLVQVAIPVGEEIRNYEDTEGIRCHWCKVSTQDMPEIEYEDRTHDKYCPIRNAREYLYKMAVPLKRVRIIVLAELGKRRQLQPFDELVYAVGEVKEVLIAQRIVEEHIAKRRKTKDIDMDFKILFVEKREVREYQQ